MRLILLIFASSLFLSSCATRVVTRPATQVTVVRTAPKHHKIVRVKGQRYYFWNGKHYRKTRNGFVFVSI